MTHANPPTRSRWNMHWHLSRNSRLVVWDLALVLAITLSLAFLATRVNVETLATGLASALGQNRVMDQPPAPILSPVDAARVSSADLVSQLKNPVPSVRVNAAQALGARRAVEAKDTLIAATYDSNARVREEAAVALGDIDAIQALPRLLELQITQGNIYIESAAFEAQGKITKNIATALKVPSSSIQTVAVSETGIAYAAALDELYALRNGDWQNVGHLPAIPNNLWVGPDGRLLFLTTDSSGLYRSQDSGQTWEHLQYGMQTPTQLTTTAVVVNPQNVDQIFVALAAQGSNSAEPDSLGIATSQDGGKTWLTLPDSPTWSVTRNLIIDQTAPIYLYGLSDVGPWRYDLSNGTMVQ